MVEKRLLIEAFGKTIFLFTIGIYLLAVPALFIIKGSLDALLPYEAVLCTGLSGGCFFWSLKRCKDMVKMK